MESLVQNGDELIVLRGFDPEELRTLVRNDQSFRTEGSLVAVQRNSHTRISEKRRGTS